ncbi:MAG: hypothetical protein CMF25_03970 [Kangiellaceae bacterium]|nr:hypothetical protein [Kangiellaceae bacterium]|tara:strand:+ start:2721 stop:3695 length:975 start_codon:yes stop_codon:yes gene_type:complete
MTAINFRWLPALFFILASLVSCSSGYEEDGEIDGTGIQAQGVIDGFGSVIMNDVHYNTDNAEVFINGELASVEALELGYYIELAGTKDADGESGVADTVLYHDKVVGKISRAPFTDNEKTYIEILGQRVELDESTLYVGTSLDTLARFDIVAVSGFDIASDAVFATRVEKKPTGYPVVVEGVVESYAASIDRLRVEGFSYYLTEAEVLGERTALVPGAFVRIIATYIQNESFLRATKITVTENKQLEEGVRVELEGIAQRIVSPRHFTIGNVDVDASSATYSNGTPEQLIEDSWVLVKGAANSEGTLLADEVVILPQQGLHASD